jgi:hypothetical protein
MVLVRLRPVSIHDAGGTAGSFLATERVRFASGSVSKLYGDVVVEFIVRRATANISSTDLDVATKALNLVPQVFQSRTV